MDAVTGTSKPAWDGAVLSRDLPDAVRRGELVAYYQPQFDLSADRLVAVEALCRWRHPELGLVPPSAFIELAERLGALATIGRFMLIDACRRAAWWQSRGHRVEVAINASPSELDRAYARAVVAACQEAGLATDVITIEVTESPEIAAIPGAVATLELLQADGVGVSIDDFGVASTSLSGLRELPFTELKIDRSLIQDAGRRATETIEEVVGVARALGARVVAEGVETGEQRERAVALGCHRAQGFLWAAPMTAKAVDRLLEAA
jgi:EAL domain-containing protein (putative c-di-GMP-specific phosphodiesterase class I)